MSVYGASSVVMHVIAVMSKSKPKVLSCLTYVLFVAYCACYKVDYFGRCTCIVCINRVYVFCFRTLDCSCGP